MSTSSYTEEEFYRFKDLQGVTLEDCRDDELEDDDDELIEYCRNFINTHFYGENKKDREEPDETQRKYFKGRKISFQLNVTPLRKFSAPVTINRDASDPDSLGTLLKIFHLMLTSHAADEDLRGTEDAIFQYLIVAAALRKREGEKMNKCFKRLLNDCKQFLQIYNKEAATKYEVFDQYWGSCQQLRCGKVIVDHLNMGAEIMDPMFGILLCPYGGQFEPSISNEDKATEAEGYHRVMFDAFDFLKRYHKTGPGPDYLGSLTLFEPNPLEAEATSRLFWQRQIDRIREEGIEVEQKFC